MKNVMVNNSEYTVFSDFIKRGTYATDKRTNETRCIRSGGYLHNELSVRKAIAIVFDLPTFRKK